MTSRYLITPLFAFVSAVALSAEPSTLTQPWDGMKSLNDGWKYVESNQATPPANLDAAENVTLPHSWNAKDTLQTRKYRRDVSWYVRKLDISPAFLAAKQRLFLRCAAAGQSAEVFFNNTHLGSHIGGYTAFTFEMTPDLVAGENIIAIRVSNAHTRMHPPISGDFNQYGGLYRGVTLITAPVAGFSRDELGGPGVRVWSPEVSKERATIRIETTLANGGDQPVSCKVVAELSTAVGDVVCRAEQPIQIPAGKKSTSAISLPDLLQPKLWSPKSPNLYSLKLTLIQDGKQVDSVRVRHGFRWYRFTPDDGFFLNGEPCRLIGMNRHQDYEGFGNALPDALHEQDLQMMKELGVNYLRPAHYPQSDYLIQRCDELGILVAEEIPYVNETGSDPDFEKNLRMMMKEMIAQHFNHPCIIVWGMGNEVGMKDRGDGKASCHDLLFRLNTLVHELDPIRKTIFVVGDVNAASELGVMSIPDLVGYNLYQGWYGRDIRGFKTRATELHQMNPDKPLIVTEFGAGSDLRLHSRDPKRFDFTEEYQVEFLEGYIDQFEEMPWLTGFNWWAFADFGSAGRGNSITHVNQKGLVTFKRKPKDAFYLWKSRFTQDPVLRIQSSAWTERYGSLETTIRVITNLSKVELTHNGKSLGVQSKDFRWPITMTKGANKISARGKDTQGNPLEHHTFFSYLGKIKYLAAKASANSVDPVANLVDHKSTTQWSAPASGWAEVDLETPVLIDGLVIEPHLGEKITYKLKVSGKVKATDPWETLWSGETEKGREFRIPQTKQLGWQYVRIESQDKSESADISLNELHIQTTTERKNKSLYEKLGAGKLRDAALELKIEN